MSDEDNGRREAGATQARLDAIERQLESISDKLDLALGYGERIARVEERQGLLGLGQAAFTAIAATIAGWYGTRP